MTHRPVKCPRCGSDNTTRFGISHNGKQRYQCCNVYCRQRTFVEQYTYLAYDPYMRDRIIFSTVKGNRIQATARTLGIARNTVTNALKSIEPRLWYVNMEYLESYRDSSPRVSLVQVDETEMDKIWRLVSDTSHQYWLWWAIDHSTGEPLAFHFGAREHENLDELLKLLKPFNIEAIERLHLPLRTWDNHLVRRGFQFSRSACTIQLP